MGLHRNSQKRIYLDGGVYFVTTKIKGNTPYFQDPVLADLCVDKLRMTKIITPFLLYAYVVMHDHLHLVIQPCAPHTISTVMHCLKRNVSRSFNIMLSIPEGEDDHPRLRLARRFRWQSSFHDHIIRDDRDLETHVHYIHNNPVKARYVQHPDDWPWSSYREFMNGTHDLIDPISG